MPEEVTPSSGQGPEGATASEAPTDFRAYAAWRATGELPAQKEEPTPAAADEKPPAKTEPDSESDDSQETGDEKDEPQEGDEGAPAKGRGGSRQRRIDRLTRENEELKRQLAGQPVTPQDKPSETAQSAPGEPRLEDFSTLEQYQKALTKWVIAEDKREREEAEAKAATEQALRTEQETWAKKEKAARKAHDDYDDLMDTIQIPAGPGVLAARQAMLEDEHGAELLYFLAKHPKELAVIAALTPASAVMAIGKLSVSLSSPAAPENGKPRITGAPKPPPPSGKSSKTTSDSLDDPEVLRDFSRYERLRKAQLNRR